MQHETARLILASGSATRAALLTAAGIRFSAVSPGVDETAIKRAMQAAGAPPAAIARALAEAKAEAAGAPDAYVIGADQILVCEGICYDKPPTIDAARAQLQALRGRTHVLQTAAVCRHGGATAWAETATPTLTMRRFSDDFLEDYLAAEGGAVLESVGAYRIEGRGVTLFSRIEGEHAAILGLPLLGLLGFLRNEGVLKD